MRWRSLRLISCAPVSRFVTHVWETPSRRASSDLLMFRRASRARTSSAALALSDESVFM